MLGLICTEHINNSHRIKIIFPLLLVVMFPLKTTKSNLCCPYMVELSTGEWEIYQ